MKYLINYADAKYKNTQKFNSLTGKYIAKFDKVIEYSPDDLDSDFKERYKETLDIPRGAGLWLWKPYIILKTLEIINEGDYLFYCDSGSFFVRNIDKLIESMRVGDIWVSDISLVEKQFTKQETLILMNAEEPEILESNQIQAGFILIRKCNDTIEFVKKWLELCCNMRLLSGETEITDKDYFIAHREDQSILSILCKQCNIEPHKDPTQYEKNQIKYMYSENIIFKETNHDDTYKMIIWLHRGKAVNIGTIIKCIISIVLPTWIVDKIILTKRKVKKLFNR